ncbi:MAG: peptidase [Ilumatobacteraceae bacterium]|nr:peptidase [Ilumatobacteraceae bacterium]
MEIEDTNTSVAVDTPPDEVDAATQKRLDRLNDGPRRTARGKGTQATAKWVRLLHVWTSMISLLVVLFFAATGITLNHPNWTFGLNGSTTVHTGTLPDGWDANGAVDFLKVSEFVRNQYDVKGAVGDYSATSTDGLISFKAPGYAADLVFKVPSGTFTLTIQQQGLLAVMNDIHKGRDTAGSWGWVIDASGGFLVVVALTGLGIQLFQRKRRRSSLIIAGVATVATLVLIYISLG